MAARCSVCKHPNRKAIDAALVTGEANTQVAAKYELTEPAVRRHRDKHLPARLVKAQDAKEVANADNLLDQVTALHATTLGILRKAERAREYRTALMAIREARGNLELLAKLMGQINEGAVVNILVNPEWHMVRTVIVEALAPFPEARVAAAEALERLDHVA